MEWGGRLSFDRNMIIDVFMLSDESDMRVDCLHVVRPSVQDKSFEHGVRFTILSLTHVTSMYFLYYENSRILGRIPVCLHQA